MAEIPKHFDFAAHEESIYRQWLSADAFAAVPDERPSPYVIMMPLPNVTGALHMGHAMDNVMQDLLIRWRRMQNRNTLWMPGTDHAGIATQAVVEKRLFELEGKTRHDVGREALVAKIWAWKDEFQQRIVRQQRQMGCSCDWQRARFTMDAVCARAVREAFFRLFSDGLIYRGNRLVNWDCHLQTAVSDDEIVYEKVESHFWHMRYPIIEPQEGEPEFVIVATTRPETMLGDTAVACHPDPAGALDSLIEAVREKLTTAPKRDQALLREEVERLERRKLDLLPHLLKLVSMAQAGRKIMLPLVEREIPLILDEWAKPELGSGCVKITPAHDPNDYDVWQRHRADIGIINILNPNGTLNHNAGPYEGQDRLAARRNVIADLETRGLMAEIEDREIEIAHSDRSKTPIEPYLSKQWFVKMGDVPGGIRCGVGTPREFTARGLAQIAIDAVDPEYSSPSGRRLTFFPEHARYAGTYRNWLSEKRDWCISRQLWWGHRIPIWHGNFTFEQLEQVAPKLLGLDPEFQKAWLADGEGRLLSLDDLSLLDPTERFDALVCVRREEQQDACCHQLEQLGLTQDQDVLDTWFSSALWPFSTLGWPEPDSAAVDDGQRPLGAHGDAQDCLSYYYPGSCLVTGRDIITLWVARMQIMGLYLLGDVPFPHCFIHAIIQDGKGERMSKSKGNGIDPMDIIESYGTDAMRYVLCDMQTGTQDIRLPVQAVSPYTGKLVDLATAKHGATIFTYICPESGKEFDVLGTMPHLPTARVTSDRFDIGKSFCTKLWNAARFAFLNLNEYQFRAVTVESLAPEDRWILTRLSRTIRTVTQQLEEYNPSAAIGSAREFFWNELCDWYLEFIKPRFRNPETAPTAQTVLAFALDLVLRLFHPFLPFITEALWELLGDLCPTRGLFAELPRSELLIGAAWPELPAELEDETVEKDFALVQNIIRSIREVRAGYNIPTTKKLTAAIKADAPTADTVRSLGPLIRLIAALDELTVDPEAAKPAGATMQVIGNLELYLMGVVDPQVEIERLEGKRTKLLKEVERAEKKLGNESFVSKAPAEVVDGERAKLVEYKLQLKLIEANLAELS